ncbi:MAG: PAS domain-containing protein [Anaerolineae bacterium]|nr:PAS domain-containing protein [Anaerolineae bacterium]
MSPVISSKLSASDLVAPSGERDGLETALASVWRIAQHRGADGLALYAVDQRGGLYLQAVQGSISVPPRISPPPATPSSPPRQRLYCHLPIPGAPHLTHALCLPLTGGPTLVGWLVLAVRPAAALRRRASRRRLRLAADGLAFALLAWRCQAELAAARQWLDEAQAGLVVLDEQWRITGLNPAAAAILNRSPEAVTGQGLAAALGQAHADELARLAAQTEAGNDRRMIEAHLSPQKRDMLMGVAHLRPGFLVSLLDVTALKEMDRLKSEIVANFSHELRAPLASIKAYTELLLHYHRTEGDLPEQFLAIVNEETDRLTELVNEVLDLSRLEAGHLEMEYSQVPLLSLVEEIVRVLHVQAQARGIQIEVEAAHALPHVWGDRQLLGMLLRNLIINAIKYNRPDGSVHISLDEWADSEGRPYTRVRVHDTGVGMAPDALPHLFNKFYRVRSTTESGIQGTGLGLTLAKAAVEAHRGQITVSSAEGIGSEFTVLLPVTSPETSQPTSQPADRPVQPSI